MRIEIDQSGKIEHTNKPTIIGYSNSKSKSLIISSNNKKRVQTFFRKSGYSKLFIIKTFAILIFLLLKDDIKHIDQIIIDREYPGFDRLIKQYLVELFKKENLNIDIKIIHINSIGKKSKAHELAITSFRKKRADNKINYLEVIKKSGIA